MMAAEENRGGNTEIKQGMTVYGVFRGSGGFFVSEGTVEKTGKEEFDVWYGKIQYRRTHAYADIGKDVYTDGEQALRGSEDKDDARYQKEREDFAEQNTQPSWKN